MEQKVPIRMSVIHRISTRTLEHIGSFCFERSRYLKRDTTLSLRGKDAKEEYARSPLSFVEVVRCGISAPVVGRPYVVAEPHIITFYVVSAPEM